MFLRDISFYLIATTIVVIYYYIGYITSMMAFGLFLLYIM